MMFGNERVSALASRIEDWAPTEKLALATLLIHTAMHQMGEQVFLAEQKQEGRCPLYAVAACGTGPGPEALKAAVAPFIESRGGVRNPSPEHCAPPPSPREPAPNRISHLL